MWAAALLLGATVLFGHPGTATAATCAEEYCYDSLGRLQVALLCGTEYRYTYDAAGNLTSRDDSAGTSLVFAYDGDNRLPTATGIDLGRDLHEHRGDSGAQVLDTVAHLDGPVSTHVHGGDGGL